MQLTPHLLRAADLVKTFETFEPQAVLRPAGGWTIGYGHTRTARQGAQVSPVDGGALLIYDLIQSAAVVAREIHIALTDNQHAALTAFAFNVGEHAFAQGAVVDRLNAGDLDGAVREMERWRRADLASAFQVSGALVQRRAAERLRFLTPPQGFERSSTPLTPPQRDPELEPQADGGDLAADAGEAPPPPVVEATAAGFTPPDAANETEPSAPSNAGERLFPFAPAALVAPVDEAGASATSAPPAAGRRRRRLPVAPRGVLSMGVGVLGLALFVLAVVIILSGRVGAVDLAVGLAGVLLMIPATYTLLGRFRRT